MVVALLLAGIDAVDADRIQQVFETVGTAHEAAAAYENERMTVGYLDVRAVSAGVATGDVGDLDTLAVKQRSLSDHLPDSAKRARTSKTALGVARHPERGVGEPTNTCDHSAGRVHAERRGYRDPESVRAGSRKRR
jgi:hypothetical protein